MTALGVLDGLRGFWDGREVTRCAWRAPEGSWATNGVVLALALGVPEAEEKRELPSWLAGALKHSGAPVSTSSLRGWCPLEIPGRAALCWGRLLGVLIDRAVLLEALEPHEADMVELSAVATEVGSIAIIIRSPGWVTAFANLRDSDQPVPEFAL